jgi:hypothetical protein
LRLTQFSSSTIIDCNFSSCFCGINGMKIMFLYGICIYRGSWNSIS